MVLFDFMFLQTENLSDDDAIEALENGAQNRTTKMEDTDPALDGTVDGIFKKVDSYMRIVRKTTRDMVPKAITLFVINELQNYINDTLLLEFMDLSIEEYVSILLYRRRRRKFFSCM